MEALLNQPWDVATLGSRISIYVSPDVRISHVLGGYQHQRRPRAVLFLNSYAARMAPSGKDATYAHELAHLLTWRYRSHTLREGLADYLALQLHPAASVGPNRKGHEVDAAQVPALEGLLGTSAEPPAALMSDQGFRRSYYAASYRFVRVLIRRGGLALFLDLYRAQDPDGAYERMYGATRKAIATAALDGKTD
jgi:hypothetical protein